MLLIGWFIGFIFGMILYEAIATFNLHKKLKSNREYIYKYLLTNNKNETLEHYVLRKFFPRYFIFLCVFIVGTFLSHYLSLKWSLVGFGISLGLVLLCRVYNRSIFQNIWKILK